MFDFKKCYSSDGTEFAGLYEIQPKVFGDSRGYFWKLTVKKIF